jgi:uncharacterized protein DUF1329
MKRIDWTRRDFLKAAGVMAGAGYLKPLLSLMGEGKTIEGAYPEQVLHIEAYTKGKVKPGMIINKQNADLIKDIAPESLVIQLQRGNTEIKIAETTLVPTNPPGLLAGYWLQATLRNQGLARLDNKGQVWTKDGKPWIGGCPFPAPKTALETMWNYTINPIRVDDYQEMAEEHYIDSGGGVVRRHTTIFQQITSTGRLVIEPKPYNPLYRDELFRTRLVFYAPEDVEGLQDVTVNYYDASRLPDTFLYIPSLRRVRRVPTTQRFEPIAPNGTFFISDLNMVNDPTLTWSYKLIGSKPMLAWSPRNRGNFGSQEDFTCVESDQKFPRSTWELRPEITMIEAVPHLPGGDVYGRKLLYFDAVYWAPPFCEIWDRAGRLWKFIVFFLGDTGITDHSGGTMPSTTAIVFGDLQRDFYSNVYFSRKHHWGAWSANTGLRIEDYMTPEALLKWSMR